MNSRDAAYDDDATLRAVLEASAAEAAALNAAAAQDATGAAQEASSPADAPKSEENTNGNENEMVS